MARIEWTGEMEIGIRVVDGQHRRIVDYINDLDAISGTGDRTTVARILDDVIDYTFSHFAFEEALMEEAGYEFLPVHQDTHQAFRARIDALKAEFDTGRDVGGKLAELLGTWLINHIMHDDASYAGLVRARMPQIEKKERGNWLAIALRRFFAT